MQAFLIVQTQWVTGMGGPTGLDYTRVKSGLELAGVEVSKDLFSKLRIIEASALSVLSSKPKEDRKP